MTQLIAIIERGLSVMCEREELEILLKDEVPVIYSRVRTLVLEVSKSSRAGEYSKEELCDIGFLCREIISKFEETRKDLVAAKSLVDRIMCIKTMSSMLTSQSGDDMVHGKLSSGKPNFKKSVTLPKKDTIEYEKMMEYFGVSSDGVELGVAKISWKQVCNHITELAELGKPIPDFIPKIHDDYTVIHRRK